MQISLSDTGKRFNRNWVFRRFSYDFRAGGSYAITGPNGSGKSTLLQVIGGAIVASEGKIVYRLGVKEVEADSFYRKMTIAAPYQELIEEMTVNEFLGFHRKFKPFIGGLDVQAILTEVNLADAAGKQIRYFSSGMKQRVKLAQAFFSDAPCLFLDEPCTNLDTAGIELYQRLVANYTRDRIVIVSSNDPEEYRFCGQRIEMGSIKD